MKKHKKQIIFLIIFVIVILNKNNYVFSYEDKKDIFLEQEKNFGINSFIENSKKYTEKIFEKSDIDSIFEDAIKGNINNDKILKKISKIFVKEFSISSKSIVSILGIIIIHSILKSISESLENENLSKNIYYVQYIAIVTVIMSNFSGIIEMVQNTTNDLVGFMNSLIPILISLMIYTGNITTSSLLEPIILFMINFIGNIINNILIPLTLIIATLNIISKIGDRIQITKMAKFLNKSMIGFLGIILTIFFGIISFEGTLASSVDGITAKTAKTIVSNTVPIVGKILGDAVDTVLSCGIILKNALGFLGIIIILGICFVPILRLGLLMISYKILSVITEPIADKKIIMLLDQIGDIFKILLGILFSISFMIIIGTALVVKMSNIGMMYR